MENKANALATVAQTPALAYTQEQVQLIKNTVAKGATDDELKMFLHLAGSYNLDPFAKEIWFIKAGNQPVTMTGHDGYLKIANENPNFDGLVSDVVYQGDSFRRVNGDIQHVYGNGDRGEPVGAYALVYKKNTRCPVYFYAPMRDFAKSTQTWRQYRHAMILKVAENMAIKRAFSLSGLVSREEMDADPMSDAPRVINAESNQASTDFHKRKKAIYQAFVVTTGNPESAKAAIFEAIGDKPSTDWTPEDLDKLTERLKTISTPDIPNPADVDFVDEGQQEG